jgi:hypothetical protein
MKNTVKVERAIKDITQQELAAAAQAGFAIDISEHLPFQQEQKGKERQGGTRNLCRFYGELGSNTLDEEPML